MSVKPSVPPIPTDTNYAAKAVYSKDNFFLVVGDRLAELLEGLHQNGFHFTGLISRPERPPLAMITILQFMEKLSDPQAVEATRTRIDWKYALHLSKNYPGLPAMILCEYRQWVLHSTARQQRFQLVVDRMVKAELLKGTQDHAVEASAVLDEVCFVTRLDMISQAVQLVLETLAVRQPEWLRKAALPHWYERYSRLPTTPSLPNKKEERESLAKSFGEDGKALLEAFRRLPSQDSILPEVLNLEEVLSRHFESQKGELSWRAAGCANCQE